MIFQVALELRVSQWICSEPIPRRIDEVYFTKAWQKNQVTTHQVNHKNHRGKSENLQQSKPRVSGWVRNRKDRDRKLIYFTYLGDVSKLHIGVTVQSSY